MEYFLFVVFHIRFPSIAAAPCRSTRTQYPEPQVLAGGRDQAEFSRSPNQMSVSFSSLVRVIPSIARSLPAPSLPTVLYFSTCWRSFGLGVDELQQFVFERFH